MSLSAEVRKDERHLLEPMVKKVAREFGKFQNIGEVFLTVTYEHERSFEYVFGFNFMKNP
jgi:cell division protein FtsB